MESMITAEGHKYRGELRALPHAAGLSAHGRGTMAYAGGDVYVGEWAANRRHGGGAMTYADGSTYDGEWAEDARHGMGTLTLRTPAGEAETYEGAWVRNAREGIGTQTFSDGERYTGTFVANERHGRGIVNFPNGASFEGCVVRGKLCGQGTLRFANGEVYRGDFLNNAMHGEGQYEFLTGDVFEGVYREGMRVSGTVRRSNGMAYKALFDATGNVQELRDLDSETRIDLRGEGAEGDWKEATGTLLRRSETYTGQLSDGVKHGKGRLVYENGDVYDGEWCRGCRHGHGTLVLNKPAAVTPHVVGWRYVGDFLDDAFHGYGELRYNTEGSFFKGMWREGKRWGLGHEESFGDVYDGGFTNDTREGAGTLQARDGRKVMANFIDGEANDPDGRIEYPDGGRYRGGVRGLQRHGEGHMVFANGDIYEGEYRADVRFGVGLLTLPSGGGYQGQWKEDAMHGNGTVTFPDGSVYEGRLRRGLKDGAGILRTAHGVFSVVYKDNTLVSNTPIEE